MRRSLLAAMLASTILSCSALGVWKGLTSPTLAPAPVYDKLNFEDPQTASRFYALNDCVRKMADPTWASTGYSMLGNFYQSNWCALGRGGLTPPSPNPAPTAARDNPTCTIAGATMDARDQHIVVLDTLTYDISGPEFGLGLQALYSPPSTGWRALFWFFEGGKSIVADGWHTAFAKYADASGPPAATIVLGWDYTYQIYATPPLTLDGTSGPTPPPSFRVDRTTFVVRPDLSLRDDLGRYLASPESMRDRGLDKIRALRAIVSAAISAHQLRTCDTGTPPPGGIPPACTPRPFSADEESQQLARLKSDLDQQESLLQSDYRDMYAAWMTAFPLNQCWP